MTKEEIRNDYISDVVTRCSTVKNINYKSLDKKSFFIITDDAILFSVFEKTVSAICEKHGICLKVGRITDSTVLSPNDILLIWDGASVTQTECITIYANDRKKATDNAVVLYTPAVYSAGIKEILPTENGCVNMLDFFASQLFCICFYEKLKGRVFYAGHGDSKENIPHLVESGYKQMITYDDGRYMCEYNMAHPDRLFCFDNTYDGKLSLLHELLFMLLCEFDRICKKHNIEYFLGGGTLLGAIRHGGMIPWDDDVDVMMKREEYEKFLSVVIKETENTEFFFQSSETDKQYHSVFTKIRLNGTRFVTRYSEQFSEMHQGIFIDIFVHDNTSNKKIGQKLHVFKTLFARSAVFHKWAGTPMHFYGKMKLVCKIATQYIKRTDIKKLEEKQYKAITKYKKKKTDWFYDGTGEHIRHGAFPEKWLRSAVYKNFNGKPFPVPENYEEYLKYSYKSWQSLIPASLRKAGHDIVKVDFGKYENKEK